VFDFIVDYLIHAVLIQLIAMVIMFWFVYSRLVAKIETNKIELKQDIEKLGNKVEKLSGKVEDIDQRLCRIEGSLSIHRLVVS